ncbi:hypothetical protein MICAH_8070003 [Microcystis aeruginosa PCC 9809]|uniref:Uncharacterized protein n=1 Tax=Microcystis aeruginosa PCC 9809 TaxID=1160285 RepID=I4I771_MICAE|nr:hypothetical protein [Microcystis aeruginosa]CCI30145.1 hypothetical protein MICAH_8070003 [Microcystis aeruginosa PCC 9809]
MDALIQELEIKLRQWQPATVEQVGRYRLFWFLCGNEVYTDRISAK